MGTTDNYVIDRTTDASILEPILFLKRLDIKKEAEVTLDLDPLHDRYRRCKECDREFMAKNRSSVFCEDNKKSCSNEFHNRIKRLAKEAKAKMDSMEKVIIEVLLIPDDPIEPITNTITADPIIAAPIVTKTATEIAIDFLDRLSINPILGTHYELKALIKYGLDFDAYSKLEKLHNTSGQECCCFIFGKYRLYLDKTDNVLIAKEY